MSRLGRLSDEARGRASRPLRFVLVGLGGFVVQALALVALTGMADVPRAMALVVAVEAAILHNFLWHEHWTWRVAAAPAGRVERFLRFNGATGVVSVAGNVTMTAGLVAATGWPLVAANAVAVAVLSLVNYRILDRWVFAPPPAPVRRLGVQHGAILWLAVPAFLVSAVPARAGQPSPATLDAWHRYVAAAEARIERRTAAGRFLALDAFPSTDARAIREAVLHGEVPVMNASVGGAAEGVEVSDGLVHHWRGWLFIPGASVDDVLRAVVEPGGSRAHRQEDVLEARVLDRRPGQLRIFLKLQRRKIVTVTYDTEHLVRYRRHDAQRASSRSEATRIRELADAGTPQERPRAPEDDRGFLWGMRSYWQYQAVPGGVLVELESMTLSRELPWGLRTIARPLIDRVARESVSRTMDAMRARFEPVAVATR